MNRSLLFGLILVVMAGVGDSQSVRAQGSGPGGFDPLRIGERSRFGNAGQPFSRTGLVARTPRLRDPVRPRYDKPSQEYLIRDIQVTPDTGEWMICVMSYSGPKCYKWAREMVIYLRKEYKLPAYVYDRGGELRRAEREKVRKSFRKFAKHQLPSNVDPEKVDPEFTKKMWKRSECARVRQFWNIPDQTAILVGAYRDKDTAKEVLREIEKLPMPDHKIIKLHALYGGSKKAKSKKAAKVTWVWQNPFLHSFVCRNPTLPEKKADPTKPQLNMKLVRQLNAHEPYSILKTKGKVTFVIAEYQLPVILKQKNNPKSLVEKFDFSGMFFSGMFVKKKDDSAGASAHSMAKALRGDPLNIDAYVLHLPRSSLVLVGSFRSFDDPKMRVTFDRLRRVVARFRQVQAQGHPEQANPLGLFPKPRPMVIPR